MKPEMETTHKDAYNGLWDGPESFHIETNKYKVFVKNQQHMIPSHF